MDRYTSLSCARSLLFCAGLLGTAICSYSENVRVGDSARAVWTHGYESFEAAEEAVRGSEYNKAIEMYTSANEVFKQVLRRFPKWNNIALVQYRIEYCTKKIARLERAVDQQDKKSQPVDLRKQVSELRRKLKRSNRAGLKVTAELKRVNRALAQAQEEAARASRQVGATDELVQENQVTRNKAVVLERKLRKMSGELSKLKGDAGLDAALVRLQKQTDLARLKETELESQRLVFTAQIKELDARQQRLSVKRETAQQALVIEQAARAHEVAELDGLREKLRQSREQAEKAALDATTATQRLKSANSDIGDLDRMLNDTRRQVATSNAAEEAVRAEIAILKAAVTDLQQGDARRQRDIDTMVSKLVDANRRIGELQAHLATARQAGSEAEARLAEADAKSRASAAELARSEVAARLVEADAKSRASAAELARSEVAARLVEADAKSRASAAELARSEVAARLVEADAKSRASAVELARSEVAARLAEADAKSRASAVELARSEVAARLAEADAKSRASAAELARTRAQITDKNDQQTATLKVNALEIQALKEQLAARNEALTQVEKRARQTNQLRNQLQTQTSELKQAQRQITEKQTQLEEALAREYDLQHNDSVGQKRITDLERLLAAEIKTGQAYTQLIQEQKRQLKLVRDEVQTIRDEHADQKRAIKKQFQELDILTAANQQLRDKLDSNDKAYAMRMGELGELRIDIVEIRRQRHSAATDAELQRQKYEAQRELNQALERDLREVRAEVEEERSRHEKIRIKQPDTVAEFRKFIEILQQEITGLKDTVEQLEVATINKDTTISKVKAARTELRKDLASATTRQTVDGVLYKKQIRTLLEEVELLESKNQEFETALKQRQIARVPGPVANFPRAVDRDIDIQTLLHAASNAEAKGNTSTAIWNYQRVLELDTANTGALTRLGNILVDEGQPDAAERYLMRAFYANPDDRDILLPLGFLLVNRNQSALAVSMLSRGVALYPEDPDMHRMLGIGFRSLGWRQAAEVQFLVSYERDKDNPDSPYNLAILYLTSDKPRVADAEKWYQMAIDLGGTPDPQLERAIRELRTQLASPIPE
jgi:chromosome segregation ATPase